MLVVALSCAAAIAVATWLSLHDAGATPQPVVTVQSTAPASRLTSQSVSPAASQAVVWQTTGSPVLVGPQTVQPALSVQPVPPVQPVPSVQTVPSVRPVPSVRQVVPVQPVVPGAAITDGGVR